MALYHCVYAEESFHDAVYALFDLVAYTQQTFPGAKRQLFWISKVTERPQMPSMETCSSYRKTSCWGS